MSNDSQPTIPFEERSFSPAKTGEVLGVCRVQIHRLIASGKLKSFTVGRARRITGRAINEYRKGGEQ